MTTQGNAPPDWMRGMFEHYSDTGSYRPEDIRRILGDPREGVIIQATPHSEVAYRAADDAGG